MEQTKTCGKGLLLVLSGPSGVGKGTVINALKTLCPQLLGREISVSISKTTRKPRVGEEEAVHYYFTDRETFLADVAKDAFYEHAEYAGNLYGTPRAPIEEKINAGGVVVLDIDTQGAFQVRASGADAMLVFLLPPSMEELENRLRGRKTEAEEAICKRLTIARKECALAPQFDETVYNVEVETAAKEICALIEKKLAKINE